MEKKTMGNFCNHSGLQDCLREIITALGFVIVTLPSLVGLTPDGDHDEAAGVPDWLKGRPDLEMRDELTEIYACMRDRAEEQMLVPLERDSLADRRLISAINTAVADWEIKGQRLYEVELPYSDTSGIDPIHLSFRLTGAELRAGDCL